MNLYITYVMALFCQYCLHEFLTTDNPFFFWLSMHNIDWEMKFSQKNVISKFACRENDLTLSWFVRSWLNMLIKNIIS